MGLRFRKSIKLGKGVRLNINKNSIGVSMGTRGARVSINSKGRKTTTVGIPGTGLSYSSTTSIGSKKNRKSSPRQIQQSMPPETYDKSFVTGTPAMGWTLRICGGILIAMALLLWSDTPLIGIFLVLLGICSILRGNKVFKDLSEKEELPQQNLPNQNDIKCSTSPTVERAITAAEPFRPFAFPDIDANGNRMLKPLTVALHGAAYTHDGVDPQDILPHMSRRQQVILIPDPDNEYDSYAVKVCTTDGLHIGWLPAGTKDVFNRLMDNSTVLARISNLYQMDWYDETITSADIEIARYRRS